MITSDTFTAQARIALGVLYTAAVERQDYRGAAIYESAGIHLFGVVEDLPHSTTVPGSRKTRVGLGLYSESERP